MNPFPIYDATTDSIRLNGCASIMLTFLMKAKFGERFDPEVLFHERMAELIRQLEQATGASPAVPGECFNLEDLWSIAEGVVGNSFQNGWWSMSSSEREQFLQNAASPWVLSAEQLRDILDDIESLLFRYRQITSVAEAAGEP